MIEHPYRHELPDKNRFRQLLMGDGILRSRHVNGIKLQTGTHIDVDLIILSHRKHFPNMKHILATALGPNQQPIGFKDIKVNQVGLHNSKCFGAGGECLPHHFSNRWEDVIKGVPYREFRLGRRNMYDHGFMIEPDYHGTGLGEGLTNMTNDYATLLGVKEEWLH